MQAEDVPGEAKGKQGLQSACTNELQRACIHITSMQIQGMPLERTFWEARASSMCLHACMLCKRRSRTCPAPSTMWASSSGQTAAGAAPSTATRRVCCRGRILQGSVPKHPLSCSPGIALPGSTPAGDLACSLPSWPLTPLPSCHLPSPPPAAPSACSLTSPCRPMLPPASPSAARSCWCRCRGRLPGWARRGRRPRRPAWRACRARAPGRQVGGAGQGGASEPCFLQNFVRSLTSSGLGLQSS